MPMILPDFKNPHFCWMTVSGNLVAASNELSDWMKAEQPQMSPFKVKEENWYIRLMLVGGEQNYVRIELLNGDMPTEMDDGFKVVEWSAIQESLGRLLGQTIDTNIDAGFMVMFDELPNPGLIRSMFFETNMGKVAIKSNGSKLLIKGAPVHKLTWYAPDEKHIHVTLEAESINKVSTDDYLINASVLMEQAFDVFVMGKAQNE